MVLEDSASTSLLQSVPAFADLGRATLVSLAAQLEPRQLADGEVLLRQGDTGDALFIVTAGELEVTVSHDGGPPVAVERLRPGALIGEMALLAGDRRAATVTARGEAAVLRLARSAFDLVAADAPELRERLVGAVTPRLQRLEIAAVLEAWFGLGTDDAKAVQELQALTTWRALRAGERLYAAGDPAEGMYLVVSGRLLVALSPTDAARQGVAERPGPEGPSDGTVGDAVDSPVDDATIEADTIPRDWFGYQVARGESVGELGVLGGPFRTDTVRALRDSHLLHVPTAVVEAHPKVMARIARSAIERLRGGGARAAHGNGLRTVALLPTHDGAPVRALAAMLESALAGRASVLTLHEASVADAFGGSLPAHGSVLDTTLTYWLNEREAEHGQLLLLVDSDSSAAWVDRCRRQADVLLLVADGAKEPDAARTGRAGAGARKAQLVLVHPAGTEKPSGTAAWLRHTGVRTWHHVRAGDARGVPRLLRRLRGEAIGLVFSSGGARGYAHIGLLQAVEELGIEIDAVAGTSMGALIAATFASGGGVSTVERAAVMFGDRKRLLDRTLPVVALTKSHGVTHTFLSIFGDARIEDLWVPFACVSADLFGALPVEHTTGPIWEAVRASTAIPGIFTPFVRDGALLVDGAVMTALPVDLMRRMVGDGTVLASSAMARSPRQEAYDFGPSVSGWQALAQYLRPRRRRTRYPTMIKTLMEATSVGSKYQSVTDRAFADVVVELPVQGFSKLGFERHEELIALGYRQARSDLAAWLERGGASASRPTGAGSLHTAETRVSPDA